MQVISARRWMHAVLVAGIAGAFTARGEAQHPVAVDVEASPYGGTATGHLPPTGTCGFAPTIGTAFGGLGARARMRAPSGGEDPAERWTVTAQVAVEGQSQALLEPGSDGQRNIPRDQPMAAGSIALGHDWRYFGFDLGLGVREVFSDPVDARGVSFANEVARRRAATYESTTGALYPVGNMRVGRVDGFHVETGFGAYSPVMLLRPAFHVGVGYATAAGHEVMVRVGNQVTSYDDVFHSASPRLDLSGAWPLTRRVVVGLGGGVVSNATRVDVDGRASVTLRFEP
jgi:hypothetical protein